MKKKISAIFVTLLVIAMLATTFVGSVIAEPTKGQKVPVEMYILGWSTAPGEGYSIETNNGGIQIERNLIVTYAPIVLVIDGGAPLVGTVVNNVDTISNLDKKTAVGLYDSVMSFSTPEGGFKGNMQANHKDMLTPEWTLKWHFVLQGYDAFEGQTLQMSREGPYPSPPGTPVTGYLLKP